MNRAATRRRLCALKLEVTMGAMSSKRLADEFKIEVIKQMTANRTSGAKVAHPLGVFSSLYLPIDQVPSLAETSGVSSVGYELQFLSGHESAYENRGDL
jgi:hypothetical protein